MTVSTVSNDYAKKQLQNQIRNYKKLDKEKTAIRKGTNRTNRKRLLNLIKHMLTINSASNDAYDIKLLCAQQRIIGKSIMQLTTKR